MTQRTEQRRRDDAPNLLDRARDRSIFVQRPVSSDFAALAFREVEIRKLARRLMRTRRRTSRSHDTQERLGRPSRQSAVSTIIREIIEKKKWSPLSGLKALTQNVNRQAKLEFPVSEDTVARALNSLYEKTQDRRFERVRRNRFLNFIHRPEAILDGP